MDKDQPKQRTIGLDFDETIAQYDHWRGPENVGDPIPEAIRKVKAEMAQGTQFVIFTARANPGDGSYEACMDATLAFLAIAEWSKQVFGAVLPITHEKSKYFDEIWDDRGRQMIPNTGVFLEELIDADSRTSAPAPA